MTRHNANSARHWTITVRANETGGDRGNSPRTAMAKRLDRQEVDESQQQAMTVQRHCSDLDHFGEPTNQETVPFYYRE